MTTLPQTTPMRVARPSNGSVAMIPSNGQASHLSPYLMGPGGPGAGAGAIQMTGADVWRVIRTNLWLIVGLVVVAGGIGFGLNQYLLKKHASFTARGLIQVQAPTTVFDPLNPQQVELNSQSLAIRQRTEANLLGQETLFSRVLQNRPDIRGTTWFQQFTDKDGQPDISAAKEALGDTLSVRPIPDSELIEVAMSTRVPRDARVIVNDIVTEHLAMRRSQSTSKQEDRGAILANLKSTYQFQLNARSEELRRESVRLNIDGMSGQPGRLNAKEMELQELLKVQFELQRNAAEAKSAYESLVGQVQQGIDPPIVSQLVDIDTDVMFWRQQVNLLDLQLAPVLSLGKENKEVQRLQTQRDAAQQRLDAARAEAAAKAKVARTEELAAAVQMTESDLKSVQEKIAVTKNELGELTYAMANYLTKRDEELALREMLKQIDDQITALNQAQQQADISGVSWAAQPETPDRPSWPQLKLTMGAAIFLGLALGLGIAFLRELLDTSVRSPRDIARVGQLNLLGMIPHEGDDPQAAGSPLPLVIAHAPHSMLAEQFRQVRTRLQHTAALESTRSILVTSPSPGDGKSTVATNLAVGLALNGRRILLVDANFRRPELHRIFNAGNDVGFSGVLASSDNFATAVQQTQVPNLDVLPAGPKPANSTELLESQLLIDFIEQALEEYDHVIFDSGPLLLASETIAMAPRVDGVVTVVRARANSRGLLQRMRDELKKLKAEHVGVVLNAVRAQAGGYYNRNIKTYYAYQNGHAA